MSGITNRLVATSKTVLNSPVHVLTSDGFKLQDLGNRTIDEHNK